MPKRVFVVDDEPGIVALCERLLRRAGFAVYGFQSPKEALSRLRSLAPDAVLVDIRMPEMDGFTFIRQAREMLPGVAVVVITGYGTSEMALRAVWAGADSMLFKPFEKTEELVEAVRYALTVRREKEAAAQAQALRPLFDVTEVFVTETRPERLRQLVVQAVQGALRADVAGLCEAKGDALQVRALAGKRVPQRWVLASGGLVRRAWHADAPLSYAWDEGDEGLQAWLEEGGMRAAVAVPIGGRPTQRLLVWAARSECVPFTGAEMDMLGILGRHAAVALENAALHERQREMLRRLEASQQALIQAEKMAAMGRLMATVAHEVNNPLQGVRNCLHLAARPDLPEEERAEFLRLAQEELERLEATVRRLLDYFRPGNVQRRPLALSEIVEKVLSLLRKRCEDQGVQVAVSIPHDLPLVLAAPAQLQQVLLNLALNALDAMPDGGRLTLRAWVNGDRVVLAIRDTGPGVPAALRERIFEPFFSTKEEGTGLGLAVSYGIMIAHGGDLRLAPGRGEGAEFHVVLPVAGPTEEVNHEGARAHRG